MNDYVISSNNSVNENSLNAKKARSTMHQIKRLLKSLLVKRSSKRTAECGKQVCCGDADYLTEIEDNLANELLEARIFEEIDDCDEFAAVPVYNQGRMDIVPVYSGQKYIPVHFARTDAGTFFWTSVSSADSDISCLGDKNAITRRQLPELQVPCDRWAQA